MRVDLELLKLRASTGVDRDVLELLRVVEIRRDSSRFGESWSRRDFFISQNFLQIFFKYFFFFQKFFGIEVGRGFDGP